MSSLITNKKKGYFFLRTHNYTLKKHKKFPAYQPHKGDITCPLFWTKGSMTIEAALILPMFLVFSLVLLSFIDVMQQAIHLELSQHDMLKKAALTAFFVSEAVPGKQGDYIVLDHSYPVSLTVAGFGIKKMYIRQRGMVHIFNGYDDSSGDRVDQREEYVYITQNGRVYHSRRSCRVLSVSVVQVSGKDIKKKRNVEGKKYYACDRCADDGLVQEKNSTVYITDYGNRYHENISCSELRRTLRVVKKKDIKDRTPCRFCSGG